MTITFTDIFCGAGGSSIGLTGAGFELRLAANHWDRAIETHAANFRDAEHLQADVSNYDMRRLPSTDVLWASPECTWHSPAGGRKKLRAQLDLLDDYVPTDGGVRSRATMLDVIRATEVHRYGHVIVENVVEVTDWPLFDWWLDGMRQLGYTAQILSLNSAHAGGEDNPWAPQWRDRVYVVFTRAGMPAPNLDPRPAAWCSACDADVLAVQSWKKDRGRRVGKYRQQYVYRCPNSACRHAVVEPYVLPAAAAIDWSDLGQRIGDRARPLAAATMRRIRAGLELFAGAAVLVDRRDGNGPDRPRVRAAGAEPIGTVTARGESNRTLAIPPGALVPAGGTWNDDPTGLDRPMRTRTAREAEGVLTPPVVVNVNHHGDDGRPYPAAAGPLAPRTTKIGDGIALAEPFVTMLRSNGGAIPAADEPLATLAAGGNHHGLTVPPGAYYVKHFTESGGRPGRMSRDVRTEPLGAITTSDHHSLVIPYRRGAKPHRAGAEPISTVATKEQHGLLRPTVEVDDCHFRMLKPREHLRAQRFPDTYLVLGNKGEQTMQAGNAVSSNVAQWIGQRIAAALGGAA